jgi:uncharacterized membrane protein
MSVASAGKDREVPVFKKILISIVAVVLLLVVIGFALPRHVRIERSITIDRPASQVYAVVNSFEHFWEWSPWAGLDPALKQSVEGPRAGVGATLHWSGNDKVGTGTQVITASVENQSVTSDIDFGDMGTAKATFRLRPEGQRTNVSWDLDSDMGVGPVGHYVGLFLDRMVGPDYEKGLARLKVLVESQPAPQ